MRSPRRISPELLEAAVAGDDDAVASVLALCERMIEAKAVTIRRQAPAAELDDLKQVGRLAVFEAIPLYDPDRIGGANFMAFATVRAGFAIRNAAYDVRTGPSVPAATLKRYYAATTRGNMDGITEDTVAAVDAVLNGTVSVSVVGDVPDPPEDLPVLDLDEALSKLSHSEREIVRMWIGADCSPMSDAEIGEYMCLSRQSVNRKRRRAFRKLARTLGVPS